jgi:hypothetical protein
MEEKKNKYPRGKHPNSLKNLRPFKKGEHGNPHGRPKKEQSITEAVRELLREGILGDLDIKHSKYDPIVHALARRWLKRALNRYPDLSMLLDRLEGKVTQPIGGDPGKPIAWNIKVENPDIKEEIMKYLNQGDADNKDI